MIVIDKWSGMITNASPYALPGGACVYQSNIQCLRPGQLQTRGGLATAATVKTGADTANPVVSAVRYSVGAIENVVVHSGTSISFVAVT